MSEDNQNQEMEAAELEDLKARADQLNIKYRKDTTAETLRKKIADELADKEVSNDVAPAKETDTAKRVRKQKEASELVRIQVTCMNPNKAEYDGEVITAGNKVVGTFRKFVKFGVEYHVPRIIYNVLRDRKCQVFVTERDERGRQLRRGKLINEFNIAVLEPLTKEELKDLAQRQAMAKGQAA
jgi:hypothetical protein